MAVNSLVLDGSQAYGVTIGTSGVLTINGVAYKCNNWQPTRANTIAEDYNPNGTPGRWRMTAGFDTFSAELQLATDSTAYPKAGDTFSATCDSNYGAETWCVDFVAVPQTNGAGDIRVIPITGRKVYNGISTSS